jgi:hypothetical protein
VRYRINWNKQRPASLWRHELLGYTVFAAAFTLLWLFVGTPWWIPLWFVGNALAAFLRLLERRPANGELTVTEVQTTTVRTRQFRF